jgi:hypothetical protein
MFPAFAGLSTTRLRFLCVTSVEWLLAWFILYRIPNHHALVATMPNVLNVYGNEELEDGVPSPLGSPLSGSPVQGEGPGGGDDHDPRPAAS